MKHLPLLLFLVTSACGAQPHPTLWGGTQTKVSRDGRDYLVSQRGSRVEVIRLGWAAPGEHRAIRATMLALIPEVTGCLLLDYSLHGGSGEMRGRVRCSKKTPPELDVSRIKVIWID